MTSIVTVDDYRRITRDTTSTDDDVLAQLDSAEQLVAEYLRRPDRLAYGTYSDRLRLYVAENIDGGYEGAYVCYPPATPIESADGGLTVLSPRSVAGAFPDGGPFLEGIIGQGVQPYATVTYTGGWTVETLPETIRREIALTARTALSTSTSTPVGATSVQLGDAAVTYGTAGAPLAGDLTAASKKILRRYMRRRAT